jgi:GTP cyclohydrolase I
MTSATASIVDVQGSRDTRRLAIDKVGIKDLRHPVTILNRDGRLQHTVGNFCLYVDLPHDRRGTHMSRFLEILNDRGETADVAVKVLVPVTSLCPCSKQISDYGAHNQRSHITLTASVQEGLWIEDLIDIVENEASCQIYGLIKRPDEKFITERAYDNPKFVEDLVRDIAARLNTHPRISAYTVESENFESIHNHSAYALIQCNKSETTLPKA